MEYTTSNGIKLRDIFIDNGNWWKLFLKHRSLIRPSIITNVLKLIVCRTRFLGYHFFVCDTCGKTIKAPHSCKSRFCSSCGKKATDDWIKNSFNTLPDTIWQHITFTMPAQLWDFFWVNRYLMNKIPSIAADIIKTLARNQGFIPGIYLSLHTFGRDLKRNIHIHLSTTVGGLSFSYDSWVRSAFFYHASLKNMWRYEVIALLRTEFKQGRLKLPPSLKHIKSYSNFSSWTAQLYEKTWNVQLNEQSDNMKLNVNYLGKYLKRPPIGETRIKAYDRKFVAFEYLDHYTQTTDSMSLPVLDFISRLISHIPDKNFRNIRYYGFLANRVRGKLLPLVYKLLKNMKTAIKTKIYTPWRNMIKDCFNRDPLVCPVCKSIMRLREIVLPISVSILSMHKEIANGHFQLL